MDYVPLLQYCSNSTNLKRGKTIFSVNDLNFYLWFRKEYVKKFYLLILLILCLRRDILSDIFFLPFSIIILFLTYFLSNKVKVTNKSIHLNKWLIFQPITIWLLLFFMSLDGNNTYEIYNLIKNRDKFIIFILFMLPFCYILMNIGLAFDFKKWNNGTSKKVHKYKIKYLCNKFDYPTEKPLLHYLTYHGHIQKIRVLCEKNPIKDKTFYKVDKYGRPPIHLTRNVELTSFFISKGVDIDSPNIYSGQTLLHLSVRRENLEVVKFLIEKGADINKKDMRKRSPLDYAKSNEMRNFLIAKGGKETILHKRIKHFLLKKIKLVKNSGNDLS